MADRFGLAQSASPALTPRWLRVYARVRLVALIVSAAVVGAAVLGLLIALAAGVRPVPVTSGEMAPTIGKGALVMARPQSASELRTGDIISVAQVREPGWFTARVQSIRDAGQGSYEVQLRADSGATPTRTLLIQDGAKYQLAVPLLGAPVAFFSSPLGGVLGWILLGLVLALACLAPQTRPRHNPDVA
ncbi:S24/S26 family peptidase [Galactobacter caseinivorans]|uniref:Signal peptidase I n=1 Tax=Galactobacter caseinivorans TaxID=2676123 RepID=A0A496PGN6_9MICC|nr:hypothetical protein [Galactobacter caseinivorans]RKW69639.1 hypothetical protein DWQ67_12705 [Galactobacter caseinivorans]